MARAKVVAPLADTMPRKDVGFRDQGFESKGFRVQSRKDFEFRVESQSTQDFWEVC